MNQEQIGKFIKENRLKNNLSQKELADKLSVTAQAISKWENGRGIPDIELLKKLSIEFNVNIDELIEGKKITNNKKIYIYVTLIIFFIIIVAIVILLSINKQTFNFSPLASDNDSFTIKGIVAYNNDKKSIYISNIDYSENLNNEKEYVVMECILYESEGNTEKKISQCGDITNQDHYDSKSASTLSELLKNVEFNIDDYSCSCKSKCDNLFLRINALNVDDKVISYNIPLQVDSTCSK